MSDAALARAWALKDAVYAAWSSEPARAADAAGELHALARDHPGAPLIDALARWTAGIAALVDGRMQDALADLEAAEAGLLAGAQPLPAAQTLVPRIMALALLGRHAESVACAQAAHRRLAEHGDSVGAAKVQLNLAALHIRRHEGAAAIGPARRAGALFARLGDHPHSVMADVSLADALAASGDFDEALRIYARAAARAQARQLPVLQALADESAAIVLQVRGDWAAALAGLESARRRYEALGVVQHQAVAEKQLADAYLELRLLPEALDLYDRAVARFAQLDVPDERAWALLQRALARWRLGEPAGADADLRQAGELFDTLDLRSGAAAVLVARAELAAGAGREALAQAALDRAGHDGQAAQRLHARLLLAASRLDAGATAEARAGYAGVLHDAAALGLQPLLTQAQAGLGAAALRDGDAAAARQAWTLAIEHFEAQRDALPGAEFRRAFAADHLSPYHGLLRLVLADDPPDAAAQVLRLLERHRARAGPTARRPGAAPDDPVRRLRERLDWLYRRLQRLEDEGAPGDTLAAEAREVEAALLETARRDRLLQHGTRAGAAVDPMAICERLQHGQAALVYAALDDELHAIVLRPGGARLLRGIARVPAVADACAALRNQMQALAAGHAHLHAHLAQLAARAQRAAARVHDLVWAPLAAAIDGVGQLVVVPQGQLAELPWAAVAGTLQSGLQIVQAPSVTRALGWLARPARAPGPPQRVLAWADTERLQHAAAEAQAIAALHPQGQALLGREACRDALQRLGPQADVLHFACHARFRRDNPAYSSLTLADGELDVARVHELRLQAELVVLAACETGQADRGAADDAVGLAAAFLDAGARRVLAAQWPIDDAIGAQLMGALHRALAAGQAPAAALLAAQREVARAHPHPYHWAAYTLHGAW